jgi:hypothetical protein
MLLAQTLGHIGDLAAAVTPTPAPKPINDDKVSPGWIGLVILVAMAVAVVFLIRSMQNRLRNIDVNRHSREKAARLEAEGIGAPAPIADDERETDKN